MGTSNLYSGPKKSVLLPPDYQPNENTRSLLPTDGQQEEGEENEEDGANDSDQEEDTEQQEQKEQTASVPWSSVRRSFSHAMNNSSDRSVKSVIRKYTKALGGHTNASRQAKTAKRTAVGLLNYFTGTPDVIRARFEKAGIKFEGRPTKDILNDIFILLTPAPNDLEDSLANIALNETKADIIEDTSIDLNQLEIFNEELLQRIVGNFLKHYIFDKLIMQSEQSALNKCDNPSKLKEIEKRIKTYIDGIVDGIVPKTVKSGMQTKNFRRVVDTLFDISYRQMEDLI